MRVIVNCSRCQANVLVLEGVAPGVGGRPDPADLSRFVQRHGWNNAATGGVCPDCRARPATAVAPTVDLPKGKRKKTGGDA